MNFTTLPPLVLWLLRVLMWSVEQSLMQKMGPLRSLERDLPPGLLQTGTVMERLR
jgi:hypothetical protein